MSVDYSCSLFGPFFNKFSPFVLAALLLVIGYRSIRRVREGEAVVIERMGKFHSVLTAGLHALLPFMVPKHVKWTSLQVVNGQEQRVELKTTNVPFRKEIIFDPRPVECIYGALRIHGKIKSKKRKKRKEKRKEKKRKQKEKEIRKKKKKKEKIVEINTYLMMLGRRPLPLPPDPPRDIALQVCAGLWHSSHHDGRRTRDGEGGVEREAECTHSEVGSNSAWSRYSNILLVCFQFYLLSWFIFFYHMNNVEMPDELQSAILRKVTSEQENHASLVEEEGRRTLELSKLESQTAIDRKYPSPLLSSPLLLITPPSLASFSLVTYRHLMGSEITRTIWPGWCGRGKRAVKE